jgi:transcriptional regulator with XRE-family HTH domain
MKQAGHAGIAGEGFAIRVMREAQGLTLRQLATMADTSASYIAQVERGEREPSRRWLASVTDALARNLRGAA